jgi:ankyrin repeat protein
MTSPSDPFDETLRRKIYDSTRARVEELWHAAWAGDVERVKEILAAGHHDVNGLNYWQVDSDPRGWRRTPLHAAAVRGHLRLAEYLLASRADVNARTKYGDTPMHFAVDNGHADIVAVLRKSGADLALKNDDDETPLDRARKLGRPDVLGALT